MSAVFREPGDNPGSVLSRPERCPVRLEAQAVRQASQDLLRKMRRLRRAMLSCRRCPVCQSCDFQHVFNASVDAAIAEVIEEWGLSSSS